VAQAVLRIDWLPSAALDAATEFHEAWLDEALHALDGETDALALVLPQAAYDHADWRRAAVRDIARAVAPKRANMVAGDDEAAIAATLDYLAAAPGVTGQLVMIGGQGAADPAN
jgi:hypothetical protein